MKSIATFLVLCFCLLIVASDAMRAPPPVYPVPPRQTEIQAQVYEWANTTGAVASDAATQELLDYLDSPTFRQEIANITALANASATELLKDLHNLILTSSIHHNLGLLGVFLDVNFTDVVAAGFIPNFYIAELEGYLPYNADLTIVESDAEMILMHYPPFQNPALPNLTEAFNRPSYTCVNLFNTAGGCSAYGGVSFVASPSYIRNMTLLSAVDTGLYSSCCLNNLTDSLCSLVNCSGWNGTMGTYNSFNHLLLGNMKYWNNPLSNMFQRRYNNVPLDSNFHLGFGSYLGYFEGDVSGALLIPDSISYLQLAFNSVFGAPLPNATFNNTEGWTSVVQTYASNYKWPIVWFQGLPTLNGSAVFNFTVLDVESMILDPFLVSLTNVSLSAQDLEESQQTFQVYLTKAIQFCLANPTDYILISEFWHTLFEDFYQALSPALRISYFPPNSPCALHDNCFAVQTITNQCVCTV